MAKLRQSGAIVLISLLILVAYYIFDEQDLVSSTEVARYQCLENQSAGPYLCISCITRKKFEVAKQSSIYIKDNTNNFKVLAVPGEDLLSCNELLQFASYQLPMKTSNDIKFEELGPIKEIISLLKIEITKQAVSKYEAPMQISTIAILQVKNQKSGESTIFTYSSRSSQILSRYFGKILAQSSLIFSIFCILYYKWQHDEIKIGFLGVISINLMILGETMLTNTEYLLVYAVALTIGFYFTKGLVSRFLALISIAVCLGTNLFVPMIYSEALVVLLVTYILVGINKSFERVGTFGIFCLAAIIICSGFKGHHHLLSLPFRKVIEYSILTLSPVLMEVVNTVVGANENYDKLPTNSAPSGVSLPGFQQQGQNSQQQD